MTRGLRAARHRELMQLLQEDHWSSQHELSAALAKRGFDISQATLSRDLREIGVIRVAGPEGSHYALPGEELAPSGPDLLSYEVTTVDANESTVLIKTWPGRAQGVAIALDRMDIEDILGTVAGDDTVLVVPTSIKKTAALQRHLESLLLGV